MVKISLKVGLEGGKEKSAAVDDEGEINFGSATTIEK
jgi:hypothetical protein